ncbi:hypothetical protein N7488_005073 [Penicillium malachiteum]|nr:hypothetical protein N7488_005073 [Penicillium malachiteum]
MSLSDSEGSEAVFVGPGDIPDFNKLRDWLQPTPYDVERSEFSRHLGSYLVGTGQWLTSTNTYRQWHEGDANGLLWIKGIPGSGKSVMAASIIDQLRKEDVPVLFFFFRQIIDANHQPVGALRDWLCQILPFSPPLQVRLKTEYLDRNRSIDSLATSDLWRNIKFALSAFPKAYCVTDALDEMDHGNEDFIQDLARFGQWRPENLKVLISSRPVVAVESPLRPFSIPSLRLEEQLVDIDIAVYVQHRLQGSAVFEEYWNLITEAVPGRANGLFLYARLAMDAFLKPGADVKEVLKELPADLNVMYNELLSEHAKRSNVPEDLQLLILQSTTHSTRPLRLLEVAEMIKATYGPIGDRSLKDIKDLVRAACGPLLQILHDETVSVVHHSFTEFLKGFTRIAPIEDSTYPILEAGPTNHRLAIACLDYLTSGCLDKLEIKKRTKSDKFFQPKKGQQSGICLQFPFIEYAAANWHIHTSRAALAGIELSAFYLALDKLLRISRDWPENAIQGLTPLHAAAKTGLAGYAAHLIQNSSADPNAKSDRGDPPLYWAASHGHADIAELLIHSGADPDGEAHEGYKPLHKAAGKNCPEVVKVLLAAGVNPLTPKTREAPGRRCGNAPTSVGHTPLMYACNNGHVKVVAEFLPYLTDPDTITKAIFWSAGSGNAACVELILQNATVDVNSKLRGGTLLFKVCAIRNLNTVKVLLAAGADPDIFCSYPQDEFGGIVSIRGGSGRSTKCPDEPRGYTALHSLIGITGRHNSSLSSLKCLSALLQAGADIHLKAPDGRTALNFACVNNIDIVKVLLEAGADPYAEADNGDTILHTDGSKDKALLPILFESGLVDVNKIMEKSNGGPLFSRLRGQYPKTALEFLKYKPNLNITSTNGDGLLHFLFKQRGFDSKDTVVDAFLSAGADPNLQNDKGETSLHVMERERKVETISIMLKAGAKLEIRDALGETPLFKHAAHSNDVKGRPELFRTLIELGARLDTRDNKGRTLLHQVVDDTGRLKEFLGLMNSDASLVDNKTYVKEIGVDIDQPNNRGKTVLHKLCSRKPGNRSWQPSVTTLFDYVIEECRNLNPQDVDGIQPLHIAAAVSEAYVFKLLNAAADIFGVTKEGMTVLHIAARARQVGIMGLVLSKIADLDDQKRKAFIDQKNIEENSALYACSSGCPETVRLLLDAGANPNLLGQNGWTPFRACAEFEIEQARWKGMGDKDNTKAIKTASIWLGTRSEPSASAEDEGLEKVQRNSCNVKEPDSTRLDEVLVDMIVHGAKFTGDTGSLRDAFHVAVSYERDYTAECLVQIQSRFFPGLQLVEGADGDGFDLCKARLESMRSSLRKEGEKPRAFKMIQSSINDFQAGHMVKLLRRGEYVLLEEMLAGIDILVLNRRNISLFYSLVDAGLSDLLDRFCTPEVASKFDDHEWCAEAEAASHCHANVAKPLLVAACSREQPNMEVVRILVEKKGVNINLNCRGLGNAVLHDLAEGATWWNVHQALPYLIEKGANLEQRNHDGETPLDIALDFGRYKGVFCKDAVEILLDNGADVNAVNNNGRSCIAKAGTDIDLIKILLAHGAQVSPAAIFSAIELGNVELLEFFLSQGDLANERRPDPGTAGRINPLDRTRIPVTEVYPLFHAATYKPPSLGPIKDLDLTPLRGPMMSALLKNGADPYATFVKLHRVEDNCFKDEDEFSELDSSEDKWKPETCTVIHEILKAGDICEPLLELPSLQLESRDSQGCTLILCTSRTERLQRLIDRGAEISAQDNSGQTIAHRLVEKKPGEQTISMLRDLLTRDPRLVHIADKAGDTPLHYVIKARIIQFEYIDLLLEHGADPLQPDSEGNTALHFLATEPLTHRGRIQKFLNLGLDINSRNKEGNTPLSRYIARGSIRHGGYFRTGDNDGLLFFEELGADFFTTNNSGASLLHVVAGRTVGNGGRYRKDELKAPTENLVQWFKYLMEIGLDTMLEDAQQRTSLDIAAACGNEHILKLFNEKNAE